MMMKYSSKPSQLGVILRKYVLKVINITSYTHLNFNLKAIGKYANVYLI